MWGRITGGMHNEESGAGGNDDVDFFATRQDFPATGQPDRIYVARDTTRQYWWSGADYVPLAGQPLGETDSTAYRGDRGAVAYAHAQTPHVQTKADLGLGQVENIAPANMPVSEAQRRLMIVFALALA